MGKEPARRRLRRVEGFTTTEVPDDEKPPLLRVFLARRARETQGHFAAAPEATDAGFRDLSPEHPGFAMRNSDERGATRLRQPDTLRRGGEAVPTSLRFALADGRLYAATPPDSGKMKHVRNDPQVILTPCNAWGRPRGESVEGLARGIHGAAPRRRRPPCMRSTGSA